jgi:23S rRNA (uracil1939-C5)-methyltransferase
MTTQAARRPCDRAGRPRRWKSRAPGAPIRYALLVSTAPASAAPCPHFGACGGCAFQDWTYERQFAAKVDEVRRLFEQAGVAAALAPEPSPPEARFFYRNRMSFVVGPGPVVGLREAGRWDAIVDLGACLLLSRAGHDVVNAFRGFVRDRGLAPYDLRTGRGEVRYLVLREGKNTGARLALAVARSADFPFADFARFARAHGCTAAALAVNAALSDVATGEVVARDGPPLEERVGRVAFEIGDTSFFQPSTRLAERLVAIAGGLAGSGGDLVDLYCGGGLFLLSLHERFARATGVEAAPDAARDAARNAARKGAANVTVIAGEVEAALGGLSAACAIVDPPRGGMRKAAVRALLASPVRTVVYVSCGPAAMARDVAALGPAFRLDGPVHVLDAAPWTRQVEAIARLVRA